MAFLKNFFDIFNNSEKSEKTEQTETVNNDLVTFIETNINNKSYDETELNISIDNDINIIDNNDINNKINDVVNNDIIINNNEITDEINNNDNNEINNEINIINNVNIYSANLNNNIFENIIEFSNDGNIYNCIAYSLMNKYKDYENKWPNSYTTNDIFKACKTFYKYIGSNINGNIELLFNILDISKMYWEFGDIKLIFIDKFCSIFEYNEDTNEFIEKYNNDIIFENNKIYAFICRDGDRNFSLCLKQ